MENKLYLGEVLYGRKAILGEVSDQSALAYKIARIRYKEGEIDLLDTLTLQREAITAESKVLSIKRAQLDQQIDLVGLLCRGRGVTLPRGCQAKER